MLVNFLLGESIHKSLERKRKPEVNKLLFLGVFFNLLLLGYFKYANFFVDSLSALSRLNIQLETIVLPLAISFFTFQQIAYLVDVARGDSEKYAFRDYALFVTFFPQLIAGPIVHHREMLPQFMDKDRRYISEDVAIGLVIFSLGLFKKAVLADGIAAYGSPIFDRAAAGEPISMLLAWGGALCYTFQLYFDFSGYSDMAIGAARIFGITLPMNFNSPYKANSIAEFWRRWHMTLSRFLRDYIYVALGGNRKGTIARYRNLMTTMLIGGLWHGAGWTFVLWGGLHGIYLVVNQLWRASLNSLGLTHVTERWFYAPFAWAITFLSVVFGWVLFRATTFDAASQMIAGMLGYNGIAIPNGILARLGNFGDFLQSLGIKAEIGGGENFVCMYLWIISLSVAAFLAPNTQQILAKYSPVLEETIDERSALKTNDRIRDLLTFRLTNAGALITAVIACFGIFALTSISEFLYFQF